MGKVVYEVSGRGKIFGFSLEIIDDFAFSMGRRGRWQITKSSRFGQWESQLQPPGAWEYRQSDRGRLGFIFCQLAGQVKLPFVIALDEVPDDYLHGPFCSVATGIGTLSPSVSEDIPIVWRVTGPGCV